MGRNVKKLEATLKQLETAQRALERVDPDVITGVGDPDCASELLSKWRAVMYYLEDLIEECHGAIYLEDEGMSAVD